MELSKSAIGTFRVCPRKFKFVYIDRLQDKPTPDMQRGIDLHKQFCEFHDEVKSKGFLETINRLSILDVQDVDNFLLFNKHLYHSLIDKSKVSPVLKEAKLRSTKLGLVGVIDAVLLDDFGGVLVLDYKTGKSHSGDIAKYHMELSIYSELLKECTEYKPTHWGIFLSSPGKLISEKVNVEYFSKTVQPEVEMVRSKMDTGDLPPKKGSHCKWCHFYEKCMEEK